MVVGNVPGIAPGSAMDVGFMTPPCHTIQDASLICCTDFNLFSLSRPLQVRTRQLRNYALMIVHWSIAMARSEPDSFVSQWCMARACLHHTTAWVHPPQLQCDITMITLPQPSWRHFLSSTIQSIQLRVPSSRLLLLFILPCTFIHVLLDALAPVYNPRRSKFYFQRTRPPVLSPVRYLPPVDYPDNSQITRLILTNLQRGHAAFWRLILLWLASLLVFPEE